MQKEITQGDQHGALRRRQLRERILLTALARRASRGTDSNDVQGTRIVAPFTYTLTAKPDSKKPGRKGLYKCRACRKQFTVTVGTVFEDSRIPLSKWLLGIHLMSSSKKGMSAHQIHRILGISYKAAWFMMHRLRYAMQSGPLADLMNGTVEVDETYVGARHKRGTRRGRPGPESH